MQKRKENDKDKVFNLMFNKLLNQVIDSSNRIIGECCEFNDFREYVDSVKILRMSVDYIDDENNAKKKYFRFINNINDLYNYCCDSIDEYRIGPSFEIFLK